MDGDNPIPSTSESARATTKRKIQCPKKYSDFVADYSSDSSDSSTGSIAVGVGDLPQWSSSSGDDENCANDEVNLPSTSAGAIKRWKREDNVSIMDALVKDGSSSDSDSDYAGMPVLKPALEENPIVADGSQLEPPVLTSILDWDACKETPMQKEEEPKPVETPENKENDKVDDESSSDDTEDEKLEHNWSNDDADDEQEDEEVEDDGEMNEEFVRHKKECLRFLKEKISSRCMWTIRQELLKTKKSKTLQILAPMCAEIFSNAFLQNLEDD